MTFLYRLAQRIARLRGMLAVAILVAACEPPVAPQVSSAARLQVFPRSAALLSGQMVDLTVVGLTAAGDTVMGVSVNWTASGGTIVDTSSTKGVHHLHWRSGPQSGRYRVWASAQASAAVADTASLTVNPVPVASVAVSPPAASVVVGQAVQLTATPVDSTGAALTGRVVTWSCSDTSKASVDANGMVVGRRAGSAMMTATSEGRAGTATIAVANAVVAVASVSVSPSAASVAVGQTGQLIATPKDGNGNALSGRVVTWGSSNPVVATVNGSGLVTGGAVGSATIVATSEGQNGTASITITTVAVASVSVSPAPASVVAGQTVQLTATPKDASGNALAGRFITWGSSNTAVAVVNGNGLVTGVSAGSATITATSEGHGGTSVVTVTPPPVAAVTVSPAAPAVSVGQTVQLTATPKDANGNPLSGRVVTWGSSNTAVATVNGNGLVTGVGAGSATITATSEGQNGTSTVSVRAPVASVSVSPTAAGLTVGQTVQLSATPKDAGGNTLTGRVVTWGSSNPAVATVNGTGLVTGTGAGSATITAASEGQNGTAAITVTLAPVASVSLSPASPSVNVGQAVQLTATLKDANGITLTGRAVTWGSSNTAAATVNGSGLVTGVAAGVATITATSETKSGTAAVTVTTASTTWPHQPAGLAVLSNYGFTTLNDSGWANAYPTDLTNGNLTVANDPTAPVSASAVAQFYYRQGDASRCGASPATLEHDFPMVQTLYIGTWAKFSSGFSFPGGTPGSEVHFLYGNPQSAAAWITVDLRQDGGVELVGPGIDEYSSSGYFTTGAWTLVELVMDYNAGTARLWINNQAVAFNGSSTVPVAFSGGGFVKVQVTPTWGGCGGAVPTVDSWLWYDHIHVSGK